MNTDRRMGKYKVLYVNWTSEIGGAEKSLLSLLHCINRERFYPLVVLPDNRGPLFDELESDNIEVITMPLNRLRKINPVPYIATVFNLFKLIRKNRIDIAHSNIRFTNQYLVPAAKLARVPVVSHVRALLSREWFLEYLFWLSDFFVANSKATEDKYEPYLRKNQKTVVIYNGVDLDRYVPHESKNIIRKKFKIPEGIFLIGVVASLVPSKGHNWFIQAFKKLVELHPNMYALLVGDTKVDNTIEYLSELKEEVEKLGLSEKVIFTSFIEDMSELYNSLDLLVLPSKEEPFGRVLIEAMSMQRPVIATNGGGCPEIIVNGKTGFLVAYKDTDGLVDAVLKIIKNPDLAREFGVEGRKRVEKLFDIKVVTKKTEQLYLDILTSQNKYAI